ncbi:MAG TPA: DMT family transporter [Candidatus Acidoferrales bacterium]|jgi:drug/metabolite transporter (DMT)-like permease|nr:DMT family transporter [Candidatus Acidoferrales bacterium]
MFAALLTTLLFATSAICGYRTSKQIGGIEANFWRITLATIFLTIWAFTYGSGFAGAPGWFMLSGFFGIGVGDTAYFQALPRLGSRRTVLLCQCFTAPFATFIEWIWLGTKLNLPQILCIAVILVGIAIALAPGDHLKISARDWQVGILACLTFAMGQAIGAVLIRKAFQVAAADGVHPDAGTTGYQRVLGGILIPTITLLIFKWRSAHAHGPAFADETLQISRDKWRKLWPWVLANALAGQTLGVTCMQWALKTTQAGIVTAITATTPIFLLPMSRIVEKEKIGLRPLIGAVVAVAGVIGLTFFK